MEGVLQPLLYNWGGLVTDFAAISILAELAEPTNRRAFDVTLACGLVVCRTLRALLGSIWGSTALVVYVWACMRYGGGSRGRRALGLAVALALLNLLQVPPTVLWTMLYGSEMYLVEQNVLSYPAYFVFQAFLALYTLALARLARVLARALDGRGIMRGDVPSLLLVVIQAMWMAPLYYGSIFTGDERAVALVIAACQVAALATMFLLLGSVSESVEAREARAQVEMLEAAARGYERHWARAEQDIMRAAELRHDYRNRMQLAAALASRGDVAGAVGLLDEALGSVGGMQVRSGVDGVREENPAGVASTAAAMQALPTQAAAPQVAAVRVPTERDPEGQGGNGASGDTPGSAGSMPGMVRLWGWGLAYVVNGASAIYLVRVLRDSGQVWRMTIGLALVAWVALTPFLVHLLRQAQRAEEEKVRLAVARQMMDARMWYGERIAQELGRARELGDSLRARMREARDGLAAGGTMPIDVGETAPVPPGLERYCDNRMLDTLMVLKAAACTDAGVRLACALDIPEQAGVSDLDLCTIFSNMLDNAIAAASQAGESGRWVDVAATARGGALVVVVRNGCDDGAAAGAGAEAYEAAEGVPATQNASASLDDEHGWGLRILSRLVERHGGSIEHGAAGGVFTCRVVLEVDDGSDKT